MAKRPPLNLANDRAFSTLETLYQEAKMVRDRIKAIEDVILKIEKEVEEIGDKNYQGAISLMGSGICGHSTFLVHIPSKRLAAIVADEMRATIRDLRAVLETLTTADIKGY